MAKDLLKCEDNIPSSFYQMSYIKPVFQSIIHENNTAMEICSHYNQLNSYLALLHKWGQPYNLLSSQEYRGQIWNYQFFKRSSKTFVVPCLMLRVSLTH